MFNFILLVSRQGKTRLTKWYVQMNNKVRSICKRFAHAMPSRFRSISQEKSRAVREITATVLSRPPKLCNFVDWQDKRVVYKRYASLYFIACVDKADNELIVLEQIHLFVEILDRYFGNVCELDIIFNFHKVLLSL